MSRRKKSSRSRRARPRPSSHPAAARLTPEPNPPARRAAPKPNPPRPNKAFLLVACLLLTVWIAFLIVLAVTT